MAAPTIYGLAGHRAPPGRHGATVGLAATIGYAGLVLGPAIVGQLAALTTLRTAIACLALVSAAVSLSALRMPSPDADADAAPDEPGDNLAPQPAAQPRGR
ncbi:MFS transporter [Streptacidiphilus sp. P02-A3a]|nr:MFS transporter [Streptacidiphilus sp. P02-A3a]